ncbi:MAG: AAA family ATPase [Acidobacteria bacterium]|nr:AAA family ATPase [Acidobacteriota bacterium]
MTMRTIAVVNQKGGCGKTITAINISAFLAKQQRKVLIIDMDPQGHTTLGLQTDSVHPGGTVSEVLLRESNREGPGLKDVRRAVFPGLDLIPADIVLSGVPDRLSEVPGREYRLAKALFEVRGNYHYVIVDCPPSVGLLTFNALMACSEAIIPLDPSFFSLHGIGKLMETLDVLARRAGHDIEPRALITLYTGRTDFVREVVADIRKHLPDRVFDTIVRFSIKLAEAASHGLPIVEYCRRCAGYDDYRMVTAEILRQEERRPVFSGEIEDSKTATTFDIGQADTLVPSAPVSTPEGVLFTLEAPEAQRVQIAGDFNSWAPAGNEMEFSNGVWRTILSLAPGRYKYRYIVDGDWTADPLNPEVERSPYGDYDSVIDLE